MLRVRSSIDKDIFLCNNSFASRQTDSASSGFPILSNTRAFKAYKCLKMFCQFLVDHENMQFKYSGVSHITHKQTSNAYANEQINVQHKILMQKDEKYKRIHVFTLKNKVHTMKSSIINNINV